MNAKERSYLVRLARTARRNAGLDEGRPVQVGWYEEYRCGCVSATERRRKDLVGYCPKHGDSRRHVHRDIEFRPRATEEA